MKLRLRAPHQKYFTKDGKQVPGVTTTQGKFAKEALYGYYAGQERDGIIRALGGKGSIIPDLYVDEFAASLPRDDDGDPIWFATLHRDSAADLGKVAHAFIEAWNKKEILERDGIEPEMYMMGLAIAERYKQRIESERFVCVHAEHVMVDEELRVGGTGDQFGMVGSEWWYRDLKTSKPWYKGKPYPENIAQAAGYAMMFERQMGVEVKHVAIDRIGKTLDDKGDFWVLTPEQRAVGEVRFKLGIAAFYCDRDMTDALKEGSR